MSRVGVFLDGQGDEAGSLRTLGNALAVGVLPVTHQLALVNDGLVHALGGSPAGFQLDVPWATSTHQHIYKIIHSRSYTSLNNPRKPLKTLARPPRFERGTPGLEGRCSIQLSYGRTLVNRSANRSCRPWPACFSAGYGRKLMTIETHFAQVVQAGFYLRNSSPQTH